MFFCCHLPRGSREAIPTPLSGELSEGDLAWEALTLRLLGRSQPQPRLQLQLQPQPSSSPGPAPAPAPAPAQPQHQQGKGCTRGLSWLWWGRESGKANILGSVLSQPELQLSGISSLGAIRPKGLSHLTPPQNQIHMPLKGDRECAGKEAWAPLTSPDSATSAFLLVTRSFCRDSRVLKLSLPDCHPEGMAQEDISHSQNRM